MLKIRLQRFGRKHEPAFRLVVIESTRGPKSGNFIEVLGSHNPSQKDRTQLNAERINYWISKGARVSPTVHNLLITKGVIKGEKVNVLPKKKPIVSESTEEAAGKGDAAEEKAPKSGGADGDGVDSESSEDETVPDEKEKVAVPDEKEKVAVPDEKDDSSKDVKEPESKEETKAVSSKETQ